MGHEEGKTVGSRLWPLLKLFIPVSLSRQTRQTERAGARVAMRSLLGRGRGSWGRLHGCSWMGSETLLITRRCAESLPAPRGPGPGPAPGPARCAEPRLPPPRAGGRDHLGLPHARPRATGRRRLLRASWGAPPPGSPPGRPPTPRSAARAMRPGPPPPPLAAAARPWRKAARSWSGGGAAGEGKVWPALFLGTLTRPGPIYQDHALYVSGAPPSFHAREGDPHSAPSPGTPASRKPLPTQADLRPPFWDPCLPT